MTVASSYQEEFGFTVAQAITHGSNVNAIQTWRGAGP
jgi:hypothetical protein